MAHFGWGEAVFLLAGISIALPLGMRVAGHAVLARRLDVVPRIVFGLIALAVGGLPASSFHWANPVRWEDTGTAPAWLGRTIFCALGIFLVATAMRRMVKREFPDDSSEP